MNAMVDYQLEMFQLIFDNISNGIIVTDADGYIIYLNRAYCEFFGLEPKRQIGRHVTEVNERTRMHIVAETGKPEINFTQKIKGKEMVVQRIPIKNNGKIVAVFGQVLFNNARDVRRLIKKLSALESEPEQEELFSICSTRYTFDSIIGESNSLLNLKREAEKAAKTSLPVLITGESGTGKGMFAQAIHNSSPRRLCPFIKINCSAIPKDLLESELFGYEKGAFTGADPAGKPGKLELGNRGTVFLDELGDFPLEMQPKILRVLEEKVFEHIGGKKPIDSDFRIIAASNQNLEEMIETGKFRKDLFYRLNVVRLRIPPLRERRNDIMPIAKNLLESLANDTPFTEIKIAPLAREHLISYDWPGNIRELLNVLSYITCFLEKDTITVHDLPVILRYVEKPSDAPVDSALEQTIGCAERDAILRSLAAARNNKTEAAKMLGIHRTVLYKKMKKYDMT